MKQRSLVTLLVSCGVLASPLLLGACGGSSGGAPVLPISPAPAPPPASSAPPPASPPAAAAPAANLSECCAAGDKDFPKVGGNLGNQNYSSLRKINKGLVGQLGGAWVNQIEGGMTTGTNQSTTVAVDGVLYIE